MGPEVPDGPGQAPRPQSGVGRRPGGRARLILAGLLLALIVELVVDIEVVHAIGVGWTLLALFAIAVVGGYVVRREGAAAWRELNTSLLEGRSPSRRLADAALVLLAGLLLIVPGFVTDAVAVLLLLPPTRALARRPLLNRLPVGGFGTRGGDVVTGEVIAEEKQD